MLSYVPLKRILKPLKIPNISKNTKNDKNRQKCQNYLIKLLPKANSELRCQTPVLDPLSSIPNLLTFCTRLKFSGNFTHYLRDSLHRHHVADQTLANYRSLSLLGYRRSLCISFWLTSIAYSHRKCERIWFLIYFTYFWQFFKPKTDDWDFLEAIQRAITGERFFTWI